MITSVREVAFLGVATAVCYKSKEEGRRKKEEGQRQKGQGSADAPTSYALLPGSGDVIKERFLRFFASMRSRDVVEEVNRFS